MMTCLPLVIWMMHLIQLRGVFGDEVKIVSVKEGDSVTLHPDVTQIQKYTEIRWTFGEKVITRFNVTTQHISYSDSPERLRDRLKLDQTGSLTITNTRTTDSGRYVLEMYDKPYLMKTFEVTVYAPLSPPVITSYCPSSSSSVYGCALLCSAVNVSHVTLSWYKGNSLLSSISVSDLSISLSLHLEVKHQDKNSYSCVINNPIRNQTTHLDISKLCHTCSAQSPGAESRPQCPTDQRLIISGATLIFLILAANVIFCIYRKHKKPGQQVQTREEEITYADPTFIKQKVRKARIQKEDDVVYAGVAMSN